MPNAIENITATIQSLLYRDGGEFQIIQRRPPDEFLAVTFDHIGLRDSPEDPSHRAETVTIVGPDDDTQRIPGSARQGDFRSPRWVMVDAIETLTGCPVQRRDLAYYIAMALGSSAGEFLCQTVAERARAIGNTFGSIAG